MIHTDVPTIMRRVLRVIISYSSRLIVRDKSGTTRGLLWRSRWQLAGSRPETAVFTTAFPIESLSSQGSVQSRFPTDSTNPMRRFLPPLYPQLSTCFLDSRMNVCKTTRVFSWDISQFDQWIKSSKISMNVVRLLIFSVACFVSVFNVR